MSERFLVTGAPGWIRAARAPGQTHAVYNLGGTSASVAEVVRAIEEVVPEAKGTLTVDPAVLGVTPEIDCGELEKAIGTAPWIPLTEGARRTIAALRAGIQAGKLAQMYRYRNAHSPQRPSGRGASGMN